MVVILDLEDVCLSTKRRKKDVKFQSFVTANKRRKKCKDIGNSDLVVNDRVSDFIFSNKQRRKIYNVVYSV